MNGQLPKAAAKADEPTGGAGIVGHDRIMNAHITPLG